MSKHATARVALKTILLTSTFLIMLVMCYATIGVAWMNTTPQKGLSWALTQDISSLLETPNAYHFTIGWCIVGALLICIGWSKYFLIRTLGYHKYSMAFPILMTLSAIGLSGMALTDCGTPRHFILAIFGMLMMVIAQIYDSVLWIKYISSIHRKYSVLLDIFSILCPVAGFSCFILWIIFTPAGSRWEWLGTGILVLGFVNQIIHAIYLQYI